MGKLKAVLLDIEERYDLDADDVNLEFASAFTMEALGAKGVTWDDYVKHYDPESDVAVTPWPLEDHDCHAGPDDGCAQHTCCDREENE